MITMRIIGCILILISAISLIGIGFICGMVWEYNKQWKEEGEE